MPLVNVTVNERSYAIACGEGEERHLLDLAAHVDGKVRQLLKTAGQAGELRLLLMAALLIADDYLETQAQLEKRVQEIEETIIARDAAIARIGDMEQEATAVLAAATARIEDVAARLAGA
jgi:cell division protein ZapA